MHFYQGKYYFFPPLVLFLFLVFWLFCLTHLHFFSLLPFCPLFTFTFALYCHWLISFFVSIVSPYSSILAIQFSLIRSCLSHNVSIFLRCTPSAIAHSQQGCQRDYNVSFQSTTNLLSCLQSLLLFLLICHFISHSLQAFVSPPDFTEPWCLTIETHCLCIACCFREALET